VVEAIARELDTVISVDTSNPAVMEEVVRLGAGLINDVRALQREGAPEVAAKAGVPVCIMHIQGEPDTMQNNPRYHNVRRDVSSFLTERMRVVEKAGVRPENIILDPGFGFGKTVEHNIQLLATLEQLHLLGHPLLIGVSRKSMLGAITGRDVNERLPASLAAATISAMKGASILRVHDVRETVDAVKIVTAVKEAI
jgi:dihydropteroate synthase